MFKSASLPSKKQICQQLLWLSNQLMPAHCAICRQPINFNYRQTPDSPNHYGICPTCAGQCQQQPVAACPLCHEPYCNALNNSISSNHLCSQCLHQPPPFIWLKTAGIYNDTMADAIHKFKYQDCPALAKPLAQVIIDQLHPAITDFNPELIVPIPLHLSRLRSRGFNQSLLLAKHLGKQFNIPVAHDAIIRTRPTSSQTNLNAKQRRNNLRNAFAIKRCYTPQRILLIDDIVTTTATSRACASILTEQNHSVAVVALGRASLM